MILLEKYCAKSEVAQVFQMSRQQKKEHFYGIDINIDIEPLKIKF